MNEIVQNVIFIGAKQFKLCKTWLLFVQNMVSFMQNLYKRTETVQAAFAAVRCCSFYWLLTCVDYILFCLRHHGLCLAEAPGCISDSASGPVEPFSSHLLHAVRKCVQMPLLAHCRPSLVPSVHSQAQRRHPRSVWAAVPVGSVSVSSLCPAVCRTENQVVCEEALQGLFLCSKEGTLVCVLQDTPQTQAEAGLSCWRVEKCAVGL